MRIIDISLPLNNKTPIYPGNVPLEISIHHAMPEHATQLSTITLGSHTGTHIDAPAHAVLGAYPLDKISLNIFIGKCVVWDFSNSSHEAITTEMIKEKIENDSDSKNKLKEIRILLKTKNSIRGFKEFYDDYVCLDGYAAEYLAELGVPLVGIDALSIKKRGGADQRPHTALLTKNIPIIEGLDLSKAGEGVYQLVCLPLNFTDIDGAPARAILIEGVW